ncbi:MAG: peptidylprolyl isomerase [Candidatus Altiarchaeota archaeon]
MEILDLYHKHHNQHMVKEVTAAHILVKGQGKATELLERIKKGESFEQLAKDCSECPSRKRGGNLGWFGRGRMVREFEKAAFEGEKGSVVGPVKTDFGWHLIKIIDKR